MDEHLLSDQATTVASMLSRLVRSFFAIDHDDAAAELPVAQIRVCGILRDGPRGMSALSRDLGISLSATTQIADRLERAGMVERVPEEADRRVKTLKLTDHGEHIMRRRMASRTGRLVRALERLSPRERQEVLTGLRLLAKAGRKSGAAQTAAPAAGPTEEQFE